MAELRVIGSDYFQTIDTPVLAGRTFDPRDTEGAPKTVVVNDAMARAHFAERGAIGERLVLDRNPPLEVEIVGVVGDIREMALRLPAGPTIYAPKSQAPWSRHETRDLIVRSRAGAEALIPAIQTVLRDLEPGDAAASSPARGGRDRWRAGTAWILCRGARASLR